MAHIVGIRFQKVGKVYHFDASNFRDLQVGDFAVVETSRGSQLGEIVDVVEDLATSPNGSWKPVKRIATPRDLVLRQIYQKKELEAVINCRAKAAELGVEGVSVMIPARKGISVGTASVKRISVWLRRPSV